MSTEYFVNAWYLGNKDDDAGKEGSDIEAVVIQLVDEDDDGFIREEGGNGPGDTLNGDLIENFNSESTLVLSDGTVVTGWYIEILDDNDDLQLYFVPTDGTVPADDTLDEDVDLGGDQFAPVDEIDPLPCFVSGTRIATARGYIAVEALRADDRVVTRDCGLQPIRWIGQKSFMAPELIRRPNLLPVLIRRDAFGTEAPDRDLLVSPNHRVLIRGKAAQMLFGESEVLVAAKHMVHLPGVLQVRVPQVSYVHFMFDRHQIVLSNGSWTESFCPAPEGVKAFDVEQQNEILSIFPELRRPTVSGRLPLARPELRKFEAAALLKEHAGESGLRA